MNPGLCICGRSPTKYCCGWHGLTEEEYQEKKKEHDENNKEFLTDVFSSAEATSSSISIGCGFWAHTGDGAATSSDRKVRR